MFNPPAPESAKAPPAGEFTRNFAAAPPPTLPERPAPGLIVVPPSPPPAPPAQNSGEFTKFFGSPYAANPLPVEQLERGTVAAPPPPPVEKPFQGPSDFTIQFGSQKGGTPAEPAAPAHSPLDAPATGLFARPEYAAPEPLLPAETPAGPSEFTRVIRGFDPQAGAAPLPSGTQSAPPPGGAVAPPPAAGRSNSLLLGVLSAAVVILILAIVVLLTR
jgi:hypothetical protein